MAKYQRVGDLLVAKGLITEAQRDEALELQKQTNRRFGEIIVALGHVSESAIVDVLARQYVLPIADLAKEQPTETALRLVSPTFALSRLILPLRVSATEFHIAICDPLDIEGTDYLTRALGKRLVMFLAGPQEIFEKILHHYGMPAAKPTLVTQPVATKPARAEKSETKPRRTKAPKIHPQPERKELLAAISGTGTDSIWDIFQD